MKFIASLKINKLVWSFGQCFLKGSRLKMKVILRNDKKTSEKQKGFFVGNGKLIIGKKKPNDNNRFFIRSELP